MEEAVLILNHEYILIEKNQLEKLERFTANK